MGVGKTKAVRPQLVPRWSCSPVAPSVRPGHLAPRVLLLCICLRWLPKTSSSPTGINRQAIFSPLCAVLLLPTTHHPAPHPPRPHTPSSSSLLPSSLLFGALASSNIDTRPQRQKGPNELIASVDSRSYLVRAILPEEREVTINLFGSR